MDWEDEYARKAFNKLHAQREKEFYLGQKINRQQHQAFLDITNTCQDTTCFLDGTTKQLCFDCKAIYKSADKITKEFIRLQIKIELEEDDYQTRYGNTCTQQ